MKQNRFWMKLIGTAVLLQAILIVFSIIEVTIYSYLISPGKDRAFYDTHAAMSGPWISAIFGSLFMFYFVRRFSKRFTQQQLTYAIALPLIYLTIDLILVLASGYQFNDFAYAFVLSAVSKIAAVSLAYIMYARTSNEGGNTRSIT